MDITLKEVETNTGYITFVCPVCGADVHVHEDDEDSLYWTLLSMRLHCDPTYRGSSLLPSGECAVCGCKG